jgi:hypothetical protein
MNRLWSFGGKWVGNAQLVSVGALAKIGRLLDNQFWSNHHLDAKTPVLFGIKPSFNKS